MFVATMVLASCSKESRLNRKLDGTWDVVSYGTYTPASMELTAFNIAFSKDKKGVGSYTTTMTSAAGTETGTGTYVLTDDTKITMTSTPVAGYTSTPDVNTITDYSKTDLTLTDADGVVIVLKKKK